jgi:hypothetical protein
MICKLVGNSRQTRASAQVHDRFFAFAPVREAGAAVAAAAGAAAAGAAAGAAFGTWASAANGYAVASIAHAIAATNRFMIAHPFRIDLTGNARYRKKTC